MYNTNVDNLKMLIFNDNENESPKPEINKKQSEDTILIDSKKISVKKINEINKSLRDSEKNDSTLLKKCK